MKQLSLALFILLLNIFVIGEAYGDELIRTDNPLDLSIVGEGCFLKLTKGRHNKYIKSVSKQPRDYHMKQAMLYCFAPNDIENAGEIEGAIILYVNKETGEELDFFVKKDKAKIDQILEDIENAISASENKELPGRIEDCKTIKSRCAKECIARDFCFSEVAK